MINAVIFAFAPPSPLQSDKIKSFLSSKYQSEIELSFIKDESIKNGFRLEVLNDVYDFTVSGRLEQLKSHIGALPLTEDIVPLIRDSAENWTPQALAEEIGTVTSVCDGIATVEGITGATYGEILLFTGGIKGMVQNLTAKDASCILFDDDGDITEGSHVKRTGKVAGVPAGEGVLGRVIGPLGDAIDGGGSIKAEQFRKIENAAPGITDRSPVKRPMETGILAIDSMFPIGRGQRELIIGDRQTGKTAIALDTILNQKGKNVICIYVAIGQKASSVAQIVSTLKEKGAMEYTTVVCAAASESPALQFIAPFAGCAIGEFFMEKGRDVLIVYDDLSKHAVAYRSLSLLLGRSPGREAYPGDVFYLHSRLLERSAQLSDALGGGSMTALPIVETQAGDVSAYIPTNIISITDGQIFLEGDLFFAGQRPAINIGISVSRVGKDAQTKAMKKSTGTLRLDLAQYREMKIFTQFSSDLDPSVKRQLAYGGGLMQLLCQERFAPMPQHRQVALLVCGTARLFEKIPEDKITARAGELCAYLEKEHSALCARIDETSDLTDEDRAELLSYAKEFLEAK
jgi:F-type H+-transporting ATPase subunit alpha